jgi:hypothetical protein
MRFSTKIEMKNLLGEGYEDVEVSFLVYVRFLIAPPPPPPKPPSRMFPNAWHS